ncbi:MAG TPA: 2-oxo acid dehydrogenase subunit E2 [Steroidobacteraceae bacterium]|nr:2-oxo acid dehydrogenase subunit E2 [Steroidobacteraceae bacterium]
MNAAESLVEVRVPDMGNFKDVDIIDVLVKPGESIEPEAPLVTLETEKATMDVPSTVGGRIEKLHVSKGGKVSTGDLIATVRALTAPGEAASPPSAPAGPKQESGAASGTAAGAKPSEGTERKADAKEAEREVATQKRDAPSEERAAKHEATRTESASVESPAGTSLPPINEPGFSRAHAGPSVRKFARELGVDLTRVTGTGFKERVTHEDVKGFVKQHLSAGAGAAGAASGALPQVPSVDFAQFGPVETQPLSRIQRISGPRLHASWVNIPHVTQFEEADITALEDARTKLKQKASQEGIRLTSLAFIVRACVKALQEFPTLNSSLDPGGPNLILKKYLNIGFAADTRHGLVVPVIREADRKDVYEIARHLAELSQKARAGKLTPQQMQGGTFTISSLGSLGGTAFTPIINAPEVAILGVSRATLRPVYRDGELVPRLILPLSLSYDHRVIDGATAVRFTTYLAETLADPRGLLEAVP